MELIKYLVGAIDEEIEDIKGYATKAAELKDSHPGLAQVLYTISTQEETHQSALHTEVVKIIEEHRRTKGEPPATMIAVYDYIHKRHIEKMAEARRYQELYKNN